MAYIGSSPTKVVSRQSANIFTYTATANQTAFTGSDANGNTLACTPSDIMVHMNGLRLEESDYTASTTTVTLGSGAAAGDEVTITAFVTFESADAYTKSTSDTRYVNTTGDTMSGDLTISSTAGQLKLTDTDGTEQNTTIKQSGGTLFVQARDNTNNAPIVFAGNGGGVYDEHLRILAGGGITFNGDTAAANALDDYETGTFQMTVAGESTGSARGSGIYVKIGNLVHFQWYSGGMNISSSATPTLSGLPFTATDPYNSAAYSGFVSYHNTYCSNANTGYINLGNSILYFTALNSTGGSSINTGNPRYCMVAGTYYTAA